MDNLPEHIPGVVIYLSTAAVIALATLVVSLLKRRQGPRR